MDLHIISHPRKKGVNSSHHYLICACHPDAVRARSACTPLLDFSYAWAWHGRHDDS